MPTAETAIFLISGDDMDKRIGAMQLLLNNNAALSELVIVHAAPAGEPAACGSLTCTGAFLEQLFGIKG